MNKYPPPAQKMILIVLSFALGGISSMAMHKYYSPPESVAVEHSAAPALMNVSAYCPGPCCCGKWADGITASGKPAVGKIVAAPPDMPFGTVLEIPGYGRCRVQDRGGAITGNKIDVLFPTHQEALNWGRQYLKVRIVE